MKRGYTIKKVFKSLGIGLISIFIIGFICICILCRSKIATLYSLKQINVKSKDYPFYTMTYKGDYGFDDYLKVGSKGISGYEKFISNEITNGLYSKLSTTPPGCSCFTATAPNGDRLFARNLDSSSATPMFLRTNPSRGYESMSMINIDELYSNWWNMTKTKPLLPLSLRSINVLAAPYLPLEGLNEHGLAIAVLTAVGSEPMVKKNRITINDYSLMRMVLDKASTVKEAVKMIKKYNMVFLNLEYPNHFMIADETGDSVVVEYVDGEIETTYSKKPYNIATNYVLYNNPFRGIGSDRYDNIEEKLKHTKGILTERQAMNLLSKNTVPGEEQWSAVYNLTQKNVCICVGEDYKKMFKFKFN